MNRKPGCVKRSLRRMFECMHRGDERAKQWRLKLNQRERTAYGWRHGRAQKAYKLQIDESRRAVD